MNIEKARKILGKRSDLYTDEQVQELLNLLNLIADIAIDTAIEKSKNK